jgi:hypothetical protein
MEGVWNNVQTLYTAATATTAAAPTTIIESEDGIAFNYYFCCDVIVLTVVQLFSLPHYYKLFSLSDDDNMKCGNGNRFYRKDF